MGRGTRELGARVGGVVRMSHKRATRFALPGLLLMLLASCGGGGSGSADLVPSGPQPAASAIELSVGSLDQPFQASQRSYSATQPFLVAEVEVRVDVPDDAKRVRLAGREVLPGQPSGPLPLRVGSNSIEIEIERPDSPAIGSYRLNVQRLAPDSVVTTAELREGNGLPDDSRQVQMALDGDRLALTTRTGSDLALLEVRIFRRDGEAWLEEAVLSAPDPDRPGGFGVGLALHDDVLVVGQSGHGNRASDEESDFLPLLIGAVHVYRQQDENWVLEESLLPPDPHMTQPFGVRAAVDDTLLVVGAPFETVFHDGVEKLWAGAIYVYIRGEASWQFHSRYTAPEPATGALFGESLALDSEHLVVTAPREGAGMPQPCIAGPGFFVEPPCPVDEGEGAVYVHVLEEGSVTASMRLDGLETGESGRLGSALAYDGVRIAASAPLAAPSGAVVVWRAAEGDWLKDAVLRPPPGIDGIGAGMALDLAHGILALGVSRNDDGATGFDATPSGDVVPGNGAVLLYERFESTWLPPLVVKPPQALKRQQFGEVVALEEGRLVVSQRPLEGAFAFPVTTEGEQALFFFR